MTKTVRSLKRLDIDNRGNFTLEGRIVHPTLISPPFLAYYIGWVNGISIESPFEELRKLPELKLNQLPIVYYPRHSGDELIFSGPSIHEYIDKCNTFIMSPVVGRGLKYEKGSILVKDPDIGTIRVQDWVSISFYKIPNSQ